MVKSSSDGTSETLNRFDLLIRNIRVEGYADLVDLGVKDGRIAAIGTRLPGRASQQLDGDGSIASPPFVDPHTHLDKAFLQPSTNHSGTLEEAIEIMQANKELICGPSFVERVDKAIGMAFSNGTMAIRTHTDVDQTIGTCGVELLIKRKAAWSELLELQIVAFPQDGLAGKPEVESELRKALELGADLIGGIPAIEKTPRASREHIRLVFDLAQEFDVDIDMHIDETDDPRARTLEMLADATIDSGWQNRVTAAHCCALSAYNESYAQQVIEKVAEADIHIVTNPTSNLVTQGRGDKEPRRRGITRVKELLAAGVNVSCGHDNMRDVFYPFGQADMLEVAFVAALTAQMTSQDELEVVLGMPRESAAAALGLSEYGIREGGLADIVLIPGDGPVALLAERPPRRAVIKSGKVVFERTVISKSHVPKHGSFRPVS